MPARSAGNWWGAVRRLISPLRWTMPLAAALAAACGGVRTAPPVEPVRVLVFNIHAGKDAAGLDNLARVAELIREVRADLVLLQEVDRGTSRSGKVDQVGVLAASTRLHAAFGKTLDYQGGEYGIALLSRWPIRTDTLIHLPVQPPQERAGGSYEPRGVLHATVALRGRELHALNTHLDASATDTFRLQEAATLATLAEMLQKTGGLMLIGGDLNATPDSPTLRSLTENGWRDTWAACGSGEGMTFPAAAPVKRIDYLLLDPEIRCDSARVLPSEASDHRPVLFVLSHP